MQQEGKEIWLVPLRSIPFPSCEVATAPPILSAPHPLGRIAQNKKARPKGRTSKAVDVIAGRYGGA